ncbi:ester cyclase [Chitinophaga nivalis]|uniref:Ester cyclase n=1 Tax=Chitinophaga nivalis TaxID=2991709 RepID=A0ABT3IHU7_9BACT|nr:ester cyclase [Chitinophaga nivalis]MCW3466776.1 ester cyclase [Chitinophaga nivalis]MCW3483533.1 ester cyclase [Chitinophaga nivalis]
MKKNDFSCLLIMIFAGTFFACSPGTPDDIKGLQAKVDSLEKALQYYRDNKAAEDKLLTRFDSLDYDIYSNQRWDQLKISHADDILVYYPDGHTTTGIDPQHINALKPQFVFAPDTRIKEHPVKIADREWTAVIGIMEGTFTRPMPVGEGKTIPPTGKAFKLMMCTVGHWKDGRMTEEYLFWDNQAFMQQIGLAK